jgi:hypothetical protein
MEPHEEGFDYQALWKRICQEAAHAVQEQRRQALWAEEALDADRAYYRQRRAGKAFIRRWEQTIDLARAINEGDTGRYIRKWYPAPSPNGCTITYRCVSEDEYNAFVYGTITDQEGHNGPGPTRVHYDEADLSDAKPYDQAADGREAESLVGRTHQKGTEVVYYLSTWDVGDDRVGLWSRARQSWRQVWDKLLHRRDR